MKSVSFYLEPNKYQRLYKLSMIEEKPIPEIVREAIDLYLKTRQEWFWSEAWQEAERGVDEELAAGNYETFDRMEEFLSGLQ